MSASVLVLNRSFVAVHVINIRRAFCLLYRTMAEIIHLEDGQYANYDFETWMLSSEMRAAEKTADQDWIRAVHCEIQAPRVIRLFRYDRVPRHTLRFNRRNVFARDGNRCQYCGEVFSTSKLSLDHVTPRSRGGDNSWENVVCCCLKCNTKKGGRTPREAHMKLIGHPVRPRQNPLLSNRLKTPKYESWKVFLNGAAWAVDVA